MFLIDAIKPNVEKKSKTCFIFLRDCLGEGSQERTKQKHYSKETKKFNTAICISNNDY